MDYKTNWKAFVTEYRKQFTQNVLDNPSIYGWYPSTPIDVVADRMITSLKTNACSKDGLAFKGTCKALGIKCTWSAIDEFLGPKELRGVA